MTTSDVTFISWLYILAAIVTSILVALSLEKRRTVRMPTTRPYRWGFYVGSMGLACAPLALFFAAAMIVAGRNDRWEVFGYSLACAVFFAIHAICGWFIVHRTRWAWVVGTILSCNIFVWIINYIYGRNRWNEFRVQSEAAQPRPQNCVPHRNLTKQQMNVLVVAALVTAYFAWLSLSAEALRATTHAASAEVFVINTLFGTVERFTSPLGIASVVILAGLLYRYRRPRDGATKDDNSGSEKEQLVEIARSLDNDTRPQPEDKQDDSR